MYLTQCHKVTSKHWHYVCSGIVLNAQSALLWHEYMARDVKLCATHPLHHR